MKHTKISLILLPAIAVAAIAFSGSPAARAQTQTEINMQEGQAASKADRDMNAAYKKLLSVLTAEQKADLRRSQRAWLVYRAGEADLSASVGKGGTIYPALYASKIAELTENRTRELKRDYKMFTI
jgi:uncharacterized protein YecT (DUF1311 family)